MNIPGNPAVQLPMPAQSSRFCSENRSASLFSIKLKLSKAATTAKAQLNMLTLIKILKPHSFNAKFQKYQALQVC